MRVLWDFRLFSHGYGSRGVGTYTAAVAGAVLDEAGEMEIVIWGDREAVPEKLRHAAVEWIPYRGGSWKKSVVAVPAMVMRHRIDIVHYWIALGPVPAIGIAPFVPCRSVATVYDAGVELWNTPYGSFIRSTPYWSMQKLFFRKLTGVITISASATRDIAGVVPLMKKNPVVIYPPLIQGDVAPAVSGERKPLLLTLAGSPHKNCRRVVDAFVRFRTAHPEYSLVIAGEIDAAAERLEVLPPGVVHEPSMQRYRELLAECTAFVYCPLHEGLGLPPLEAMSCAAPLLLSSIGSLEEIAGGYACFTDPLSVGAIADGMDSVVKKSGEWAAGSSQGAQAYRKRSAGAGRQCRETYTRVLAGRKQP